MSWKIYLYLSTTSGVDLNGDTDIKYILGNSTIDFEKILKFLTEVDILDEL